MNKIQKLVYLTLGHDVCERINSAINVEINPLGLLIALINVTGKSVEELADEELNFEKIVFLYQASDEFKMQPSILAKVELEESIIPEGTEQALCEKQIKHNGEIWVVHKNDDDPFPSDPHAHNYESNLKLHLGNGDLYLKTKLVSKIKHKDLIEIRKKLSSIELPTLERRA